MLPNSRELTELSFRKCLTRHPENVPAEGGKILLQRPGMLSGGGMTRRALEVPPDAGASPRRAGASAAV